MYKQLNIITREGGLSLDSDKFKEILRNNFRRGDYKELSNLKKSMETDNDIYEVGDVRLTVVYKKWSIDVIFSGKDKRGIEGLIKKLKPLLEEFK